MRLSLLQRAKLRAMHIATATRLTVEIILLYEWLMLTPMKMSRTLLMSSIMITPIIQKIMYIV